MTRYFFDIHENETLHRDTDGTEVCKRSDVRLEAMRALPEIAREAIPQSGDRQSFVINVRDRAGAPIYSATLSFVGVWMDK